MATASTNRALAELFREAATILDLLGANAFKAVAFRKVASTLDNLPEDVAALHAAGGRKAVEGLNGIGASSAGIIADVVETGRSADHDALVAQVPADVLGMLELPGLGPKTVALVWRDKGIETFDALSAAIDDGSLATLKGLGAKKLERIREGLTMRAAATERRSLGDAVKLAATVREMLAGIEGVGRIAQAGSVRRGRETVGDLDFVILPAPDAEPARILETFSRLEGVERVLGLGGTKCSVVLADGLQVDVRVVPPESFGAALCYFTGSAEHNRRLRGLAAKRGLTLTEWGLHDAAAWRARDRTPGAAPSVERVAGDTEASVYTALGLCWVAPELREDAGEIELATDDALPRLLEPFDYRGDLHCHTVASDGTATIDEMAEAAKALGHAYLAITDHSVSQRQANGLDAKRLLEHAAAVRAANARIDGIELLAGTECDILADGRLDYDDAVLAELDWVVASPHVALRQDAERGHGAVAARHRQPVRERDRPPDGPVDQRARRVAAGLRRGVRGRRGERHRARDQRELPAPGPRGRARARGGARGLQAGREHGRAHAGRARPAGRRARHRATRLGGAEGCRELPDVAGAAGVRRREAQVAGAFRHALRGPASGLRFRPAR